MSRLKEIEERLAKATPGPWIRDGAGCLQWEVSPLALEHAGARISVLPTIDGEELMDCCDDAEFIAHSREDVEWLVEQVNNLQEDLDREWDFKKLKRREFDAKESRLLKAVELLQERRDTEAVELLRGIK